MVGGTSTRSFWGRGTRRGAESGRAEGAGGRSAEDPSRSRRHGGHPQDRALYTCGCGHRFDALVSTSVGCPHCGSMQAW